MPQIIPLLTLMLVCMWYGVHPGQQWDKCYLDRCFCLVCSEVKGQNYSTLHLHGLSHIVHVVLIYETCTILPNPKISENLTKVILNS
jgi:hypothetical protein